MAPENEIVYYSTSTICLSFKIDVEESVYKINRLRLRLRFVLATEILPELQSRVHNSRLKRDKKIPSLTSRSSLLLRQYVRLTHFIQTKPERKRPLCTNFFEFPLRSREDYFKPSHPSRFTVSIFDGMTTLGKAFSIVQARPAEATRDVVLPKPTCNALDEENPRKSLIMEICGPTLCQHDPSARQFSRFQANKTFSLSPQCQSPFLSIVTTWLHSAKTPSLNLLIKCGFLNKKKTKPIWRKETPPIALSCKTCKKKKKMNANPSKFKSIERRPNRGRTKRFPKQTLPLIKT